MNGQEKIYEAQLTEERAKEQEEKIKFKRSKTASRIKKTSTKSFVKLLIPFLIELSPFGILPSWSIFVLYTWREEKKNIGRSPNLAEYLIIGGFAVVADILDVLDLTGFGAIIARAVDIPILAGLWIWRASKKGLKIRPSKK